MALPTSANEARRQQTTLELLLEEYLKALRVKGYSEHTEHNRLVHIRFFLRWCTDCGINTVEQITTAPLRRYQEHTLNYRKRNGDPLTASSRHARLVPLRGWFRWMARQRLVPDCLANEIELPRLGRPLPRNIMSAREVERVLAQPDLSTAVGVRDRTILEVLYSTGIRRLELVRLGVDDLQLDRKLLFVREGKGKRDRYVPVGGRAAEWLQRYVRDVRPQLAKPDLRTLFVSRHGRPISRDHLTAIARRYIGLARLGKSGACHVFRHTMATPGAPGRTGGKSGPPRPQASIKTPQPGTLGRVFPA